MSRDIRQVGEEIIATENQIREAMSLPDRPREIALRDEKNKLRDEKNKLLD